jgi:hypothetical protein
VLRRSWCKELWPARSATHSPVSDAVAVAVVAVVGQCVGAAGAAALPIQPQHHPTPVTQMTAVAAVVQLQPQALRVVAAAAAVRAAKRAQQTRQTVNLVKYHPTLIQALWYQQSVKAWQSCRCFLYKPRLDASATHVKNVWAPVRFIRWWQRARNRV